MFSCFIFFPQHSKIMCNNLNQTISRIKSIKFELNFLPLANAMAIKMVIQFTQFTSINQKIAKNY